MEAEDKILYSRLSDGLRISAKRPWFMGFLDEKTAALSADYLKREKASGFRFWGGFKDAERVVLGLFPDYLSPEESEFPISSVSFRFREIDRLSHRDFLGSLMSKGVERSVIGDILVESGRAVAFFRSEASNLLLSGLDKIGRVGVKLEPGFEEPLPAAHEFRELSGVVASERLDCIAAFLLKQSREKAAGLIRAGLVTINHREMLSVAERVREKDVLSVRGCGRFIIDCLGPKTSKGRLQIKCRKYI